MKHGTLAAALIVAFTPLFRALACKSLQPVFNSSARNAALKEAGKNLSFNFLLPNFCFIRRITGFKGAALAAVYGQRVAPLAHVSPATPALYCETPCQPGVCV